MAGGDDGEGVPLGARDVAGAAVRVSEPAFVSGRLHWLASSPDGTGRSVLCSSAPGEVPRGESPPSASLRSRLYGYGAGSWCATPHGLVGIDAATQQPCVVTAAATTPVGPAPQPGDACGDPVAVPGSPLVVLAAELATGEGTSRGLVAVDLATGARTTLLEVDGRCAEPQVARDGHHVAWIAWGPRARPWEAAELWVAALEVSAGSIACRRPRRVDGGRGASVGQPTWRADGSLAYVSEAAGFWQPWVCDDGGVVRRLSARRAEFQRPRWTTCRWLADGGSDAPLVCAFADGDGEHVAVLDDDGTLEVLDQPCVRVDGVAAADGSLGWVGATTTAQGVALVAPLASGTGRGRTGPPRPVSTAHAPPRGAPAPERFVVAHGGVELDGVLWRPTTPTVPTAPVGLVVTVHPGPTGAVDRSYAPVVHLLAANGFAVASLDYSGSTAHGRAHRERLDGRFGVLDVAECVAAAAHLVAAGVADPRRLFVRGTSAGGTTAVLALGASVFAGAVAWYPESAFADDDDGFEAGYLTTLLGGPGEGRSPLARAAELTGAVLVVQGALDEVVPLAGTRALVDALAASLEDVELLVVEGEGHGFRTDEGRRVALEAELAFYLRCSRARAPEVTGRTPAARYDATTTAPTGSTDDERP